MAVTRDRRKLRAAASELGLPTRDPLARNGLLLRPATAADIESLFAGYERTIGPYVERIWGWDRRFQSRRFYERYALALFRVIERDGRFGGAIHVERGANEIYLALLYLLPELQGRGIGAALVRELLEEGRRRAKPVALTVIDGNPARRLYERLGFRVASRANHSSRMTWGPDEPSMRNSSRTRTSGAKGPPPC